MRFYKCIFCNEVFERNELIDYKKCPKCKTVIKLPSNLTYAQTKEDAKEKAFTYTDLTFDRDRKAFVIINEQHSLLPAQIEILENRIGDYEIIRVPAMGWTLKEQYEILQKLVHHIVIFVSPIPYLMKQLSFYEGYGHMENCDNGLLIGYGTQVLVFHNDKREKKELPNGKIISVVAETGWQLV